MEMPVVLTALRRNKAGVLLIVLQVALTVAIVSNSLLLAQQQVQRIHRPTGLDEAAIFSFSNIWTGDRQDLKSRLQTDLAALRSMPGVVDVVATEGLPLRGGGFSALITRHNGDRSGYTTALYPVDEHALHTLGLHMVAGRWFNSSEIIDWTGGQESPDTAPVVVVTQSLARALFPRGDALGKVVFFDANAMTIVGIVERMQAPTLHGQDEALENSVLVPYLWAAPDPLYVMRVRPQQRDAVLQATQRMLFQLHRDRVITGIQTFPETRANAYRPFRAMSLILTAVSTVLLITTAVGIVGLTSFWVTQRRRQIGIRRALGARRLHILRYFHGENLLVVGTGALVGAVFAVGANLLMVRQFEMIRMPGEFLLAGIVLVLCLGQLSVLWPAMRAAAVSPASAARTV